MKARGVEFSLDERSVEIELPSAEVSYSTASGNTATNHTVLTKPVSLIVELVVPQGSLYVFFASCFSLPLVFVNASLLHLIATLPH